MLIVADVKSTLDLLLTALYKIINNTEPGEHILELKVIGEGVELFAFTFG